MFYRIVVLTIVLLLKWRNIYIVWIQRQTDWLLNLVCSFNITFTSGSAVWEVNVFFSCGEGIKAQSLFCIMSGHTSLIPLNLVRCSGLWDLFSFISKRKLKWFIMFFNLKLIGLGSFFCAEHVSEPIFNDHTHCTLPLHTGPGSNRSGEIVGPVYLHTSCMGLLREWEWLWDTASAIPAHHFKIQVPTT